MPTVLTLVCTENSCDPLMASADVAVTAPAATFWICRVAVAVPTETTEVTPAAALFLMPSATLLAVTPAVKLTAPVVELAPKATSLIFVAVAPLPSATAN